MPIRQNKKWGKEMRMSVCLTQPINRAVIVIVSKSLGQLRLTKVSLYIIIYSEPRGHRMRKSANQQDE
jgi:hypothetical protein